MIIFTAAVAAIIESVVSFAGAALVLVGGRVYKDITHRALGFAVGALLGVVFFDVLPEAIREIGIDRALAITLAGIFIFFIIERFFRWYHMDESDWGVQPYTRLILIGGVIHNAIDGVAVGLSFLVDFRLGIATTVAILVHEIPHGISDFTALVRGGYERNRAFAMSFVVSMCTVPTAILTAALGPKIEGVLPYVLAAIAGNFLYLSLADLLPETHEESGLGHFIAQLVLMALGAGLMFAIGMVFRE